MNFKKLNAAQIQRIKDRYPPGTRIRLGHMDDPYPVPEGTEGTVTLVNGFGDVEVTWDNGSTLSLIPGVDSFSVIQAKQEEKLEMTLGGM